MNARRSSAVGGKPSNCTVELRQPPADEEIEQTKQMLSEKAPDWQPETEEDFGSLFAQPVVVVCKPKTASK